MNAWRKKLKKMINPFKKNEYKVVLKTSGKRYVRKAKTINEALTIMGLTWNQIKAKGIVTIYKGKYSYEHLFTLLQLRKIFGNKLTRAMWSKRLELLLKESE